MSIFEIHDPRFRHLTVGSAGLDTIATGLRWAEGPVWFGDLNCLLFSDIPNQRIMRWVPGGAATVFREPSNFANGHNRDRQGRLISCEHGARRVTRTEIDGSITVLADSYQGKKLNSPNDLVCQSDGSIWFTDPTYGIMSDYEGFRAAQELPCHVYRVDPDGTMAAVLTDFNCPNGLCFSPDETTLYVVDTGRMGQPDPQHIRRFAVDGVKLSGGDVFHKIEPGCADGIRVDTDGNLWSSAADGVHCIAPDGHLMGRILVPETVSNICFGGRSKERLFITASTSLYAISLNRSGAQRP